MRNCEKGPGTHFYLSIQHPFIYKFSLFCPIPDIEAFLCQYNRNTSVMGEVFPVFLIYILRSRRQREAYNPNRFSDGLRSPPSGAHSARHEENRSARQKTPSGFFGSNTLGKKKNRLFSLFLPFRLRWAGRFAPPPKTRLAYILKYNISLYVYK